MEMTRLYHWTMEMFCLGFAHPKMIYYVHNANEVFSNFYRILKRPAAIFIFKYLRKGCYHFYYI